MNKNKQFLGVDISKDVFDVVDQAVKTENPVNEVIYRNCPSVTGKSAEKEGLLGAGRLMIPVGRPC